MDGGAVPQLAGHLLRTGYGVWSTAGLATEEDGAHTVLIRRGAEPTGAPKTHAPVGRLLSTPRKNPLVLAGIGKVLNEALWWLRRTP